MNLTSTFGGRQKLSCLLLCMLLTFLCVGASFGQASRSISGVVSDINGAPLVGASVAVSGTSSATITGVDGRYIVSAAQGQNLTFSLLGYITHEITVGAQSVIDVTMSEDAEQIEDVVVVGYGTMRKSDIAGSVASVDQEQMMKRNPTNLAQGLQGAAAGVLVSRTSGDPAGGASIRIRGVATVNGSADPLYVVDGIQVGTDANFVNPADIERMEILKDASSTAIYGARGANGVILITTKKGQQGRTRLNVTANFGVQQLTGKIDVADADLFAYSVRTGRANDNTVISNPAFGSEYNGQLHTIDWQDAMTRTALRQDYNVSASGGNEKTQANFSVGYLKYQGIVIQSEFSRLSSRANITQKINNFIEMGGSLNYIHSENRGGGNLRNWAILTPTMDVVENNKLIHREYDELRPDGNYYTFLQQSSSGADIQKDQDNPYAVAMRADKTPSYSNRIMANAYINLTLLKGLTFRTIGSYNFSANDGSNFTLANGRTMGGSKFNSFSMNQSQNNNLELESYLTYAWKNDNHNLTVMAGNNISRSWGHNVNASAQNFLSDSYRNISLTSDQTTRNGGGTYNLETRYVSWYGRAVYSLKDKYSLIATIRRDGSSNFGAGNRWGTFPSAAVAWRLSEESFIKDLNFFTNLKLRASWGQTGNAGRATDLSVAQLSSNRISYDWGTLGGSTGNYSKAVGFAQLTEIDTNLKWETNTQTNIGLDIGVLKNELDITLDYFIRDSRDLLIYKQLRPSTGHARVYTNAGHIRNIGFEFTVAYRKQINDWSIGATFTGSTLKNKVIDVGNSIFHKATDDGDNWDNHSVTQNGYAVGSFYGYKVAGIFQSKEEVDSYNKIAVGKGFTAYQVANTAAGDYRFVDVNNDSHIDAQDQVVLGNGFPMLNYGLTINLGWKRFDFMMHTYGVAGVDIFSYSKMKMTSLYKTTGGIQNTLADYINGAWTKENKRTTMPRLTINDSNMNRRASDAYVISGDFLKIANMQIGYTLPASALSAVKMSSARIYFSVDNVATFSKYKPYGDPEVGEGNVLRTGFDGGRYPYPTTYTLGLSFQF